MAEGISGSKRVAALVDELQSRGKYTFTRQDLAADQRSDVRFKCVPTQGGIMKTLEELAREISLAEKAEEKKGKKVNHRVWMKNPPADPNTWGKSNYEDQLHARLDPQDPPQFIGETRWERRGGKLIKISRGVWRRG